MDSLLHTISTFGESADESTRRTLAHALRKVAVTLETPNDTIQRIVYQPTELAVVRTCVELGVFKILASSDGPTTVDTLCDQTGADHILLSRLLRYLASVHIVTEVSADTYEASQVTRALTKPGYEGGTGHHMYTFLPALQEMPGMLKATGYKNMDDETNCGFNKAFGETRPIFLWINDAESKQYMDYFNPWMHDYHDGKAPWTTAIDLKAECAGWQGEAPLFVDVGGGLGGQCLEFLKVVPDLPGKVVLQDLEATLQSGPEHPQIQKMAHDFMTPQPIVGAKYYFLRNILHDWSDDNSVLILRNLSKAMGKHSKILINEVIIPDVGAHPQATSMDILMMVLMGSMERTRKQWVDLLARAGLKIEKITTYGLFMGDSVIQAVPA